MIPVLQIRKSRHRELPRLGVEVGSLALNSEAQLPSKNF
jgi:hypothetical protein